MCTGLRKTWMAACWVALALTGCVTNSQYGNHLQSATVEQQTGLARDVVKQLVSIWPPAKTHFELRQATPDAFGATLVKALRESGYALMEYNAAGTNTSNALPLHYVVDQDESMYRITLMVGNQSITRPYLEHAGVLVPAGYWVRKE